jgi:hypothetical protein
MRDSLLDYYYVPVRRPVDLLDSGARLRAIEEKVCRLGKHPVTEADFSAFTDAGKREYNLSGSCEGCFDRAFAYVEEPDD